MSALPIGGHMEPMPSANAGGHEWHSCSKKESRSPSLAWQAMYIHENS